MSGFTPSAHPIQAVVGGLGLVWLLTLPGEVFAQPPGSGGGSRVSAETSEQIETTDARDSNAFWWLYVSALGLGLTIPLALVLYRKFRGEGAHENEGAELAPGPEPVAGAVAASPGSEGRSERIEQAFFSTGDREAANSSARERLGEGGAVRMCPECGEQFPASVVVCPHDSTPLETIERAGGSEETLLERQRCPGCGRRYEPGPAYCYHDGMRLRQDTSEKGDEAPVFDVCERCGWEGQVDRRTCPRDGGELTAVDPSEESRAAPPIPVLCCPECGELAEPGRARCPNDEAVLTPLDHPHRSELPARGFGPRRKICPECGASYSAAGRYCTEDGSELVSMN